jgi:sugar/nucleoside kinase (ribokinase family)
MKYVVVSAVVTDEIHFPDGNVKIAPGGAGFYALCGLRLWSDQVVAVTGIGEDYEKLHGEWYRRNHISMEGFRIKDARSPYTIVEYFPDGERIETPALGLEHFRSLETTGEEVVPYLDSAEGMYIFRNLDPDFWNGFLKNKKDSSCKIMWEIAADAAQKENLETVRDIAGQLHAFSINMTEAKSLFGTSDREQIIEELRSWGLELIFLRQGAKGAVMITADEVVEVPSQPDVQVVDATGGGNSSTGAVLCGLVEGRSLEICGRMGSISAAMCISQYGVPEEITEEMRKEAWEKAICKNMKGLV